MSRKHRKPQQRTGRPPQQWTQPDFGEQRLHEWLTEEPQFLGHVRYRSVTPGEEPQMWLDPYGFMGFVLWNDRKGYIATREGREMVAYVKAFLHGEGNSGDPT
jgi:hypothetical protein